MEAVKAVKPNPKPKAKVPEMFSPNAIQEADHQRGTTKFFFAPIGVELDHLTDDPGRWAVVRQHHRLEAFSRIEVFLTDRTWVELMAASAGPSGVQMVVLRSVKLPAPLQDMSDRIPPGFSFSEDERGIVITRLSDGVVIGTTRDHGFQNREAAVRYLLDHASLRKA